VNASDAFTSGEAMRMAEATPRIDSKKLPAVQQLEAWKEPKLSEYEETGDSRREKIFAWYDRRPERNHESVAMLFLTFYGGVVCFSPELNRWLYFAGKAWRQDSAGADKLRNMLMDFNKELIDVVKKDEPYLPNLSEDEEKAAKNRKESFYSWVVKLNNNYAVDNVLKIAATRCAASINDFDSNDYLFNVKNGTIDLRTGALRPHEPEDRITLLCDDEYNPAADYARWDSFLVETCGRYQYVQYLKKEAGYCLTGLTDEELLFMLYGDAATGKSTFYEPVMDVLGDYGHYMSFATLKSSDKDGGAPREDLLRLRSSRLVMCSEVNPKTKFDTALVKKIVSGEKVIARGIHARDSAEYAPKYKIFIGTNYAPIIPFDDAGSYRRIRVNPFVNRVADEDVDRTLKRTFRTEKAARERILAWLVEGAVRYFDEGLDDTPREIERANSEYRREQNPLYLFVEDYCVEDIAAGQYNPQLCTVQVFVEAFNYNRAEYGAEETSKSSFGRYMRVLPYERWVDGKKRGYTGLRLKTQKEKDADVGFYEYNEAFEALLRFMWCPNIVLTLDTYKAVFPYFCMHVSDEKKHEKMKENRVLSVKCHDLTELRVLFVDILTAAKGAHLALEGAATILKAATEKIKRTHGNWRDYDVLGFITRLTSEDKDIAALMLELTNRCDRPKPEAAR
jgi:P4 family phage/plasmid primase-like protien